MHFIIHVFKLEGETQITIDAPDVEEAQKIALAKANTLTYTKGQSSYIAIAFEGLGAEEPLKGEPK